MAISDISGKKRITCFTWKMLKSIHILQLGGISIMMRQTNAVWLLFIAGTLMLQIVKSKGEATIRYYFILHINNVYLVIICPFLLIFDA